MSKHTVKLTCFHSHNFESSVVRGFRLNCYPSRESTYDHRTGTGKCGRRCLLSAKLYCGHRGKGLRSHFFKHIVFPMRALDNGIITFKNHILSTTAGNIDIGCRGSPRSTVCSGGGRLCNLFLTGRTVMGRSLYCLMRNCASIVSVRRVNIRGIMSSSKATLAASRVHVVRHFASGVAILCSNSTTKVGTSRQNVSVLLTRKVGIGLLLLPSKSSPSDFSHGRGTARCRTCLGRRRISFLGCGASLLLRRTRNSPVGLSHLVDDVIRDVSIVPSRVAHSICAGRATSVLKVRRHLLISTISGRVTGTGRRGRGRHSGRHGHRGVRTSKKGPRSASSPGVKVPPVASIPFPAKRRAPPLSTSSLSPIPRSSFRVPTRRPPIIRARSACVPDGKTRSVLFCHGRLLLVRMLVQCNRHVIYRIRGRSNSRAPVDMTRCVRCTLRSSNLRLRGRLRGGVLRRTFRRVRRRQFAARHCFLGRPSRTIDVLTFRLYGSGCLLDGCRSGRRGVAASRRHLSSLIPRLVSSFGLTVMSRRLGRVLLGLHGPTVLSGGRRCVRVVGRCGRVGSVRQALTRRQNSHMVAWDASSSAAVVARGRVLAALVAISCARLQTRRARSGLK